MSPEEYVEQVERAYQGEVYGEALFGAAGRAAGTGHQQETWGRLEELERTMKAKLEPVVKSLGIDTAADPDRLADGARHGAALGSRAWAEAMESFLPILEPAIERFEGLLEASRAPHRETLDLLLKHEVALLRFALRELGREEGPSLEPIREAMAALAA